MAELFTGLDPDRVSANVAEVRERIAAAARRAGREPGDIELLAAVKYVPAEELGALTRAGITLVGENRAQELAVKAPAHPELTWDFIGHLQSRKVRQVLPLCRLIHSVASESALRELGKHAGPTTEVLLEVNVAGEQSKGGIAPEELGAYIERCPVRVAGLMTMPPLASEPAANRGHFAVLRELAGRHGLERLSMGTSQDYEVAVEEGATIVRVGEILYR